MIMLYCFVGMYGRWGILQFADGPVNSTQMKPYPEWTIRHIAMSLYDAQRAYFASSSGAYTKDLVQLRPLAPPGTLDGSCFASIVLQVSEDGQQWAAEVRAMVGNVSACIRDDRLLTLQARGTCTGILAETVGRWTEANGQRSLGNNTMFK